MLCGHPTLSWQVYCIWGPGPSPGHYRSFLAHPGNHVATLPQALTPRSTEPGIVPAGDRALSAPRGADNTPGGVQTMENRQKYVIPHTIELSVKTAMFFVSALRCISAPFDLCYRVRRSTSGESNGQHCSLPGFAL